ncbi:MAG: nucleoside 2-deoxyribosyltransferase [Bacilli bacterium]
MKKVYIASPFFNEKEVGIVQEVERVLQSKGLQIWSPRLNQFEELMKSNKSEWSLRTYHNDIQAIDSCDYMVGVYFGNYSDSGTAFEFGYQVARGKPLILVHVGEDSNLMCHEGAVANVIGLEGLEAYDFTTLKSTPYTGKMF